MSKRKIVKPSKGSRTPSVATRSHGKKQAIIRSSKDNLLRSVAAAAIESAPELQDDAQQEASNLEKQEALNVEKQDAPTVEKGEVPIVAGRVQDGPNQMRGPHPVSALGFLVAYQAALSDLTQANMRFAFDFSQKLATISSPFFNLRT